MGIDRQEKQNKRCVSPCNDFSSSFQAQRRWPVSPISRERKSEIVCITASRQGCLSGSAEIAQTNNKIRRDETRQHAGLLTLLCGNKKTTGLGCPLLGNFTIHMQMTPFAATKGLSFLSLLCLGLCHSVSDDFTCTKLKSWSGRRPCRCC